MGDENNAQLQRETFLELEADEPEALPAPGRSRANTDPMVTHDGGSENNELEKYLSAERAKLANEHSRSEADDGDLDMSSWQTQVGFQSGFQPWQPDLLPPLMDPDFLASGAANPPGAMGPMGWPGMMPPGGFGAPPTGGLPLYPGSTPAELEARAAELDMRAHQLKIAARQAEIAAQQARGSGPPMMGPMGVGPDWLAGVGGYPVGNAPMPPGPPWGPPAAFHDSMTVAPRPKAQKAPFTSAASKAASSVPAGERTTVMLRNIPNNYNREMVLELLDTEGFAGRYDFVYLPMDFHRMAGLGYAFVNLVSPAAAAQMKARFDGFTSWRLASQKQCEVAWGEPLQGLQAHIERYRNSPVMHEEVKDQYKPVLFKDGKRIPFPAPTKRLRPPRVKKSCAGGGGKADGQDHDGADGDF